MGKPLLPESKVNILYVVFGLCVLANAVPDFDVQNFALIVTSVFMVVVYRLRKKWPAESFEHTHVVYVIRHFWIWSILFLVARLGAGYCIYLNGDASMLTTWYQSSSSGAALGMSQADMQTSLDTALDEYLRVNFDMMVRMALIWIIPAQLYAGGTIIRGLSLTQKSRPISSFW